MSEIIWHGLAAGGPTPVAGTCCRHICVTRISRGRGRINICTVVIGTRNRWSLVMGTPRDSDTILEILFNNMLLGFKMSNFLQQDFVLGFQGFQCLKKLWRKINNEIKGNKFNNDIKLLIHNSLIIIKLMGQYLKLNNIQSSSQLMNYHKHMSDKHYLKDKNHYKHRYTVKPHIYATISITPTNFQNMFNVSSKKNCMFLVTGTLKIG